MNYVIDKVLVAEEDIRGRVDELGKEITRDYAGMQPIAVCVLRGAIPFYADLILRLYRPSPWIPSPFRVTAAPR